ncbi:MAG: efflux RND transporter periplasmic adaptor subunit [Leeuwenhoekiella sp.]
MKTNFLHIHILLSLLILTSCGKEKPAPAENTEVHIGDIELTQQQFEQGNMQLGKLEEQTFTETVSVNGMIDVPPENRAVITAFMGGYIKENPLLIGDQVKKGDLLITLENPEFVQLQQEYQENAEQLAYLKAEYERHQILFEEKITSQKNYLKSESEYKRTLAMYNGLGKKLQMLNINTAQVLDGNYTSTARIYSPITGTIAETHVSKGSYVSQADPIMEIVDIDHIHLELSVYERDMLKVKKGQKISFTIPESSTEKYAGEVHLIGNSLSSKNRTVKVHGHILNEADTPNFAVGMFINAEIQIGENSSLSLPAEAVVNKGEDYYVLQLVEQENNSYAFEQLAINPGRTNNGNTEILNADELPQDANYLVRGAFDLIKDEGGGGHGH